MTLTGQTLQQRVEWLREDLEYAEKSEVSIAMAYAYGYLVASVEQFLIDADAIAQREKARNT